jgi:hypothetical protein
LPIKSGWGCESGPLWAPLAGTFEMVVDAVSPLVIVGPVDTSPAFTVAVENRPVLPEDPPLTERRSLARTKQAVG